MEGAAASALQSIALDWLGADDRPRLILRGLQDVSWCNASATHVIDSVSAVAICKGRLNFRHAADEDRFRRFLAGVGAASETLAMPFDGKQGHILFHARYLERMAVHCVELGLDDMSYQPKLADVGTVFGLTRSEAKTATALFGGQTVQDVASVHAVSIDTVRTHVRQIYVKLGIKSREQFFRKMLPYSLR